MYALASLGLRVFCVAGVGQCEQPRGRMYALASLGLRVFCVAGVGQCALPRGRMYALASLGLRVFCVAGMGLRRFCVAGVGQCALPRGQIYALAGVEHVLTRSLTHSLYLNIHTHKLTHHHRSITLMLPLPFLLFYAQSKSREVGNMWGYPAL